MDSKSEVQRALYRAAIDLVEIGKSNLAEETYKLALELNPNDYRSITNLAVIIDKSGRQGEAEKLYLKTANYPFFDEYAMFNLGYLYSRQKQLDLAETWYRRAIVAYPRYFEAYVNLAVLKQELGQDDEAKELLLKALDIYPIDCIANFELANIYRKNKDFFEADLLYRRAVDMDSTNPHALFNLASFLVEQGKHEEAQEYFDLAYELDTEGRLKPGKD